jgi:hypothetical protein
MSWASRHNLLAQAVNRNLGGVPFVWGAVSASGIFEQNSQLILDDQVISLEYAVHNLPTALFGGLKYNDAVTVDGQSYTVREPMVTGDGRYMMVTLSKVDGPVIAGTAITTLGSLKITTLDGRYLVTL